MFGCFEPLLLAQARSQSENTMQPRPSSEPPVVSINEGCRIAGIGRTKLYELIKEGQVTTVTIGRRRLVHVASIYEMLGAKGH
jgi:predicted DNA-binding transcriptional regulator AlpA